MKWFDVFLERAGSGAVLAVTIAAVVVVAALVNRFRPLRRRSLARSAIWLGLYVISAVAGAVSASVGAGGVMGFFDGSAALFRAWCGVATLSVTLFELVFPAVRIRVAPIVGDLTTGAAYFFVTGAVLSAVGLELGSALAASTVAAAILTISLQGTLGNVVGGVALQLEGSLNAGDWVRVEGGREGRVAEVRWRHTILETRDGDTLVMPNAVLLGQPFLILGRRGGESGPHRMWVHFCVDFRYPPNEVAAAVRPALLDSPIPNVAASPAPDVVCLDLGRDNRDSYAIYAVRYWLVDPAVDDPTSSVVRSRLHAALRRAGIPLARPSHTQFRIAQDDDADREQQERRHARGVAALRDQPMFENLTDAELDHLADHLVFAPFDAGEVITRQGAVAHWLYVLQSGTADIVTHVDGAARHVTRLEAPSLFGEMGLMTGEPRLADVVAVTPVVCYRLEKVAFDAILHDRPALAESLAAALAHRRMQLLEARENGTTGRAPDRERTEELRILAKIRDFFGLLG